MDQRGIKKRAGSAPHVKEVASAYPRFRIGVAKTPVGSMHCRGHVLGLASLIWAKKVAVEDFKYQGSKVERVQGVKRM